MGGRTAISIPKILFPASNQRKNLIFMDHQKKGTAKLQGSNSCGNKVAD